MSAAVLRTPLVVVGHNTCLPSKMVAAVGTLPSSLRLVVVVQQLPCSADYIAHNTVDPKEYLEIRALGFESSLA